MTGKFSIEFKIKCSCNWGENENVLMYLQMVHSTFC